MEFSRTATGTVFVFLCVCTSMVSEYTFVCVCSLSVVWLLCDEQESFPTQRLIWLR